MQVFYGMLFLLANIICIVVLVAISEPKPTVNQVAECQTCCCNYDCKN